MAATRRSADERFERLYDDHATRLLVFFARRTVDIEIARDLWAETLAAAYAGRRRFRGRSDDEAAAWLYGIANRQLARYWRRGRAELRALHRHGLARPALEDADYERIEALAGLDAVRADLARELSALSAGSREAVRLRVVDELPYPEVAARLAISESTARARVSRALRRLAEVVPSPAREECS